jgi:DNA-binding LytR/AlgR family response regulator
MYTFEDKLLLQDGFFKTGRSYIVNIHHISSFTQKEITLRSGCKIPISRGCHKQFEEAYFSILFGKAGEN